MKESQSSTHRARRPLIALAWLAAGSFAALGGASCKSPRRAPAPMEFGRSPLPPGSSELYPEGPEEVLVVRHADPVQVRLAGQRSSFPLRFFSKDVRVPAGSRVLAAPGGIVELFWPSGSTVVMYGPCVGVIGSVSRGEPTFVFATLENARLELRQGDQIQLPGGAILTGDSGPFVLERVFPDILRVHNQAASSARIAFRDAVFDLDPSQVIDLPILSRGTPFIKDPNLRTLDAAGFQLEVLGDVERLVFENGVRMRARGENQIVGLGVEVSLTEGEEVGFLGLERLSERAGVELEPLDSGQNPVEQGPVEQGSSDGDQDGGF